MERIKNLMFGKGDKMRRFNESFNKYLRKANAAMRQVFRGAVAYDAIIAEEVEWSIFDFVGVDHYWSVRFKDRYLDMLKPLFALGKPMVITEFGAYINQKIAAIIRIDIRIEETTFETRTS
jgi:hypothetical protein